MPSIFVRVNTYPLNVKVSSNNSTSALSVSFTILSNQHQIGLSSVMYSMCHGLEDLYCL